MAVEKVTKTDLDNLKNTIKLELTNEETERRHEDRRKSQQYYVIVDEIKEDNALLKQAQSNMAKTLEKIENTVEKIFDKLDGINDKFVTKEEHRNAHEDNKQRIARVEWGIIIVLTAFAGYLFTLAGSHIFK